MSILNDEQRQAVFERFANVESPDAEQFEEAPEAPEEDLPVSSEEEQTPSTTQDVKESSVPNPSSVESGRVPYNRFRKVIEERNEMKSSISSLQAEIEAMKKNFSSPGNEPNSNEDDSYLDEYLDPHAGRQLLDLQKRISSYEKERAKVALQNEISEVRSTFPDVPEKALLQATIQNPDMDLMEFASQYQSFITSVKNDAISNYKKSQAPKAAPRAGATKAAKAQEVHSEKKPASIKEATRLARKMLGLAN